ncbi:hypothetical protein pb186bvf_016740 [Paramecium bursaria]
MREACVNNYLQAKLAFEQGADRVELCDNLHEGGTTPSYGTIKKSQELSKNIVVMIRPRQGNFTYTQDEIDIMVSDIEICKQLGVQEIITGILIEDKIDIEKMKFIISISHPIKVVFHMAIDETSNYEESIKTLIQLGIKRVLTKGGNFKSAIDGIDKLKFYQLKYQEITFLAGGGITNDNKHLFSPEIKEIHGTKLFNITQNKQNN